MSPTGHARPLAALACNLLALDSGLHVTLLTAPAFAATLQAETDGHRALAAGNDGRLRIVSCLADRYTSELAPIWQDRREDVACVARVVSGRIVAED